MALVRMQVHRDLLDDASGLHHGLQLLRLLQLLREKRLGDDALPDAQIGDRTGEWKVRPVHAHPDTEPQSAHVLYLARARTRSDALAFDLQFGLSVRIPRK